MAYPVAKKYGGPRLGISTEAPLTDWPEGFVMDCNNFDVLMDGSLKRRYGLAQETAAYNFHIETAGMTAGGKVISYLWEGAALVPTYKILVMQIGYMLYLRFWDGKTVTTLSPNGRTDIDLVSMACSDFQLSTTNLTTKRSRMSMEACSFSSGMGRLYVTHKYLDPHVVELDTATLTFKMQPLLVIERDYLGVTDDGIPVDVQPKALTESHRYNLINRGWTQANIDSYFSAKTNYPAKNMLMSVGYRRLVNTSYAPEDGIKEFSPDKLANDLFGEVSAPQGHLITPVWDTTQIFSGVSGSATQKKIDSATGSISTSGILTVTATATAHGLTTGNTTNISAMKLKLDVRSPRSTYTTTKTIAGLFTVTVSNVNTFSFTTDLGEGWYIYKSFVDPGYFTNNAPPVSNTTFGERLPTRFRLNTYFLGRVWYAGLDESRVKNRIYFSQVVDSPEKAAYCLTQADPTDLNVSDPIVTDGGYITINEMGDVMKLVPYGNSMLIFTTEGIWQIGPGDAGFFSPLSYSVRRISDTGTRAPDSIVLAEGVPLYWGTDGIYVVNEDTNTGYLTVQNISKDKINRLYTQIQQLGKERAIGVYDDLDKRIMWFYGGLDTNSDELSGSLYFGKIGPTFPNTTPTSDASTTRRHVLILDMRTGAYSRYEFGLPEDRSQSIYGAFIWPLDYTTTREQKIKLFTYNGRLNSGAFAGFMEFSDSTTYRDFNDLNADAFLITGPESLGDAGRLKQAPYVHCFFRRVEGSGCLMQPVWDWSKTTYTGNVGNPMRVYREVERNQSGSKMVVTRNKVLGKGRSLYLGFHSLPSQPCWLEGWQVDYGVTQQL